MTPAVFFDRDGTLIEEAGYLDRLENLRLFPYTVDALRLVARAGFKIVIATNQSGVALGYFDEAFVHATHRELAARLEAGGAHFDAAYYCPHHPDARVEAYRAECGCRKPAPGLAHRAADEMGLDLARSWVVGDRWRDVGLAAAVGARGVLVRTGYGAKEERESPHRLDGVPVVDNVMGAVSWILEQERGR